MGKSKEQQVKRGFVVIATLSIGADGKSEGVSPALRNRFVTIAIEAPVLDDCVKTSIARVGLLQAKIRLDRMDRSDFPGWALLRSPSDNDISYLSVSISQAISSDASDECDHTVRGLVLLAEKAPHTQHENDPRLQFPEPILKEDSCGPMTSTPETHISATSFYASHILTALL
jgi:hypothetical protein